MKVILHLFLLLHKKSLIDINNFDVKICDFGISKNFKQIECEDNKYYFKTFPMLTVTGTITYSAPEIFQGTGYTNDVDLWSVGILTYELLFGKVPFYSE